MYPRECVGFFVNKQAPSETRFSAKQMTQKVFKTLEFEIGAKSVSGG